MQSIMNIVNYMQKYIYTYIYIYIFGILHFIDSCNHIIFISVLILIQDIIFSILHNSIKNRIE